MGKLKKISGPVVHAEEMSGSQINEIVSVGKEKLMGEIIALKGTDAAIQVYEDTLGLRPGEPVIPSGDSLSVELGPGLLSGVFDGIQRPLSKLSEKSSFIARGVTVNSLDRAKKWEFVPVAKKGSKVTGGDVLGTVREFDIEHKILVPPKVSGKLDDIKEGKFTIEQTIAVISEKGKNTEVKMYQRWPVRIPRPCNEKRRIELPLLTGMRIFDTFFPVAKGGAAAIPGPFGSGKCVSGETPVLLADGTIKPIMEIYEEKKSEGKAQNSEQEEIVELNNAMELFTMKDNKIEKVKVKTLFKGKSDYLVRIKLRSGKYIEVTPVHKLFKVDNNLKVQETEAHQLKVGEYLAAPRQVEASEKEAEINYKAKLKKCKHIHIPEKTSPSIGEFFGLFISEGYIRGKRTVVFTNKDKELRSRFSFLAQTLFGVETTEEKQIGKTENVIIHSFELAKFLEETCGHGSINKFVPKFIMRGTKQTISSFLEAFYEGDGSFYKNEIELSTSSKSLLIALSYLLLHLGVLHTCAVRKTARNDNHRIFIRGKENIAKFAEQFNLWTEKTSKLKEYLEDQKRTYNAIDPAPISSENIAKIYAESGKPYAKLKKQGIEITNYTRNKETINAGTFQKLVQIINTNVLDSSVEFLKNFYCDEILSIEKIEGPADVYDFVVPETHNFIGGFGGIVLHNTVAQTSLAKYCNANIIVYVGCGERGNEMTEVLSEFPKLTDPHTGKPLMNRTVLIANTSNMPVAAREASIYTGITIAEYFRDMGYDIALMADSTSRWAEAMMEISGRMEEMPGEEGYPAYLNRKLAEFYERTGRVTCLGSDGKRTGSVTAVGAVSPAGGDLSEPVSQGTLSVTKVFWALDAPLARRRHYPAINWLKSYSLYHDDLEQWYAENVSEEFYEVRSRAMALLQKEAELQSIVQLIGPDALPDRERIVLEVTKMIREDFLQQNAYDPVDATSSLNKQFYMLKTILHFYDKASAALNLEMPFEKIVKAPEKVKISQMKRVEEKDTEKNCKEIMREIDSRFKI